MLNKVAEDYLGVTTDKNKPLGPVTPQGPINNNECQIKCLEVFQECGDEISSRHCGEPMSLQKCSQKIYAEFHICMTLFDNPAHPLRHESLCSWLSESCKCERKYAQKSLAFVREALACLIQKARAAGIENCPCFLREKARFEQIIRDFSQIHGENNDRGAFCDTHRILCNQIGPQNQRSPEECAQIKERLRNLREDFYHAMIESKYQACRLQAEQQNQNNPRQFYCDLCRCEKTRYAELEGIKFKICDWLHKMGCMTKSEFEACKPDPLCMQDPSACIQIDACDQCQGGPPIYA